MSFYTPGRWLTGGGGGCLQAHSRVLGFSHAVARLPVRLLTWGGGQGRHKQTHSNTSMPSHFLHCSQFEFPPCSPSWPRSQIITASLNKAQVQTYKA